MVAQKISQAIRASVRGTANPAGSTDLEESFVGLWVLPDAVSIDQPAALDEHQSKLVQDLESYAKEISRSAESDHYAKWEARWLAMPQTYERYLRAENWKLEKAKHRLKDTLEWRREYKPDLIKPTEIREETEGGKVVVSGFTNDGMPIIYLRPANENTEPSETQIRHMIFALERAIELLPEGQTKICMIVDFKGASARSSPPMSITKSVVSILQKHYPERLGRALVCNLPWYLKSFFSTVSPFLDHQTRQKLKMNPNLLEIVPKSQLDAQLGGSYKFAYDWQVYLPAICLFCGVAEDGTRSKDKAGPSEGYSVQATPALLSGQDRTLSSRSQQSDQRTASSQTLVASEPSRVPSRDGKEQTNVADKENEPPARHRRFRYWLCASADHFDDDAPKRQKRRKRSRGSFGEHLPKLTGHKAQRTSALDRVRKDAAVEGDENPDETEAAFKRGEPVHFPPGAQPEVLHALEASTAADMKEPPLIRSGSKNELDLADRAKDLLETGQMKSVTSDHAEVMRPAQMQRNSTLASEELTFEVHEK